MRSLRCRPISYPQSEALFALFQPHLKSLLRGSLLSMLSFAQGFFFPAAIAKACCCVSTPL